MALRPGTRLGPYEITAPLGVGGMGEVFRATDTKLKREVAIKILPDDVAGDRERLARFEREAQVLASLNHPNIASIYRLEETDGVPCLVLELVEGRTLAETLASGTLPVEDALRIALQIATGLEAAHERGIIHRDLKPANVMITPEGTVKILDFGLAKVLGDATPEPDPAHSPTLTHAPTQAGMILGTAAYMAPEQAQSKPTDRRADIWAFGAVLFEMLSGRMAFPGDNVAMILSRVLGQDPDWSRLPSDLSPRLVNLMKRCLRKAHTERIQAIGDARIALKEYLDNPGTERDVEQAARG